MQRVIEVLCALHEDLELEATDYSGYLVMRLTQDSSIAVPRDDDHGHNTHLTLTGQETSGRLFPSVTNSHYLAGDTAYKRSMMVRVDVRLFDTNLRMLFERCRDSYGNLGFTHTPEVTIEHLNHWIGHLNGDDPVSNSSVSYRRSRRVAGGPYNEIQLEMGDSQLDGRDFIRLRNVLGPNDYIVFLRHRNNPVMYSVFGLPSNTDMGEIPNRARVFGGWLEHDGLPNGYIIPQSHFLRKPGSPLVELDDLRFTVRTDATTALSNLYQLPESIAEIADVAQPGTNPVYNPVSVQSQVRRAYRLVRQRQGQPQFRAALRERYGDRCQISGCHVMRAVEAAHIQPYDGPETNNVLNGVLLRSDIHVLFDQHLIRLVVEGHDVVVEVHESLEGTDYWGYNGQALFVNDTDGPSREALQWRNDHLAQTFDELGINWD